MAQIITVCFETGRVKDWGLNRFEEAARRCNAEALRQPEEIAATLRRCAAQYQRQAEGAGA